MKKIITIAAISAATCLGLALPASASGSPVAGNYVIADNGQGCWAGGPLFADGTGGGGGGCSFSFAPGVHEVLRFTTRTWSGNATTGVTLCVNAIATHDPAGAFPSGEFAFGCAGPIPVNQPPIKVILNGGPGTTLVKVDLR